MPYEKSLKQGERITVNSGFARLNRVVTCAIFLFGLSGAVNAQSRYPLCPIELAQQPLPVLRPAITVQVSQEALRASILFPRNEMKFEVRTLPMGQLSCISPVGGSFSLFWPFAMEAIEHDIAAHPLPPPEHRWLIVLPEPRPLPEKGRVRVIITPDPYNPPPELLKDPEIEALTCDSKDVDVLLDGVRRSDRSASDPGKFAKELQCVNAALVIAPGSFAVQYVAGLVDWRVAEYDKSQAENRAKNKSAALEHYRIAVAIAPDFYEAREVLANALHETGEVAEAEKVYLRLAEPDNPLPVQQNAELFLTLFYDKENDRPRALLTARKEDQLKEFRDTLEVRNKYLTRNIERAWLAAREEEAGEFAQAANDYLAARNFTDPKLYYDAVFFEYDMGRARSLRANGDLATSATLCKKWKVRVTGPMHSRMDLSGGAIDWGGSDVAQARWEFSCGDFHKGIQELFATADARLCRFTDKWGPGSAEYYLAAPFNALESAFLAHQESKLARQTHDLKEKIQNANSQADLDNLKELTKQLKSKAEVVK